MWTAEGPVRPGIYIWPRELQSPIRARLTRVLPGIPALPKTRAPRILVQLEIPVRQRTLVPLRIRARPIPVQPGDLAVFPISLDKAKKIN